MPTYISATGLYNKRTMIILGQLNIESRRLGANAPNFPTTMGLGIDVQNLSPIETPNLQASSRLPYSNP